MVVVVVVVVVATLIVVIVFLVSGSGSGSSSRSGSSHGSRGSSSHSVAFEPGDLEVDFVLLFSMFWGRQCPKSKNNCSLNSSPPSQQIPTDILCMNLFRF